MKYIFYIVCQTHKDLILRTVNENVTDINTCLDNRFPV